MRDICSYFMLQCFYYVRIHYQSCHNIQCEISKSALDGVHGQNEIYVYVMKTFTLMDKKIKKYICLDDIKVGLKLFSEI